MNQNYNDIGLSLLRDYNERVAVLSATWEPDATEIQSAGWEAGMTDPGVPELLETGDRVSRLVESLTSGLVPPDLVGNGFTETSGTGQVNRKMALGSAKTTTTTQSATSKNQWNKPEDALPDSAISSKTEDPKTAPKIPPLPETEPARLKPIPFFSDNDTESSDNTAENATGQKPNGIAASPAAGRSEPSTVPGDQEFRPLGKLSDMGNYRQNSPPPFPESDTEHNKTYYTPVSDNKEVDESRPALRSTAKDQYKANTESQNNSDSNKAVDKLQGSNDDWGQTPPLDLGIFYEELTRKLNDEYERFYED